MASQLSAEDRDELAIPSYLHKNPALRWMAWRRVTVIAQRIERALAAVEGGGPKVAMDFGCGTGVLLAEISRHADRVHGVDLVLDSAQLLVREWGLGKVSLHKPDEAAKVVAPGSLDVLVAAEVLEHVEPLAPTLELFKTWLKPGGRLLVSLPTENALYRFGRRLAGFSGHYHHSNAASIHKEIAAAGFRKQRLQTIPLGGPLSIYWVIDYLRP
jgi:2-polyprenyl-3-methyl-5-hydroxy-6-metoxy-1,4-benzoquinol methylase